MEKHWLTSKPLRIFNNMKNGDTYTKLWKQNEGSSATIWDLLQKLSKNGLVRRRKVRRENRIYLTSKGEEVQKLTKEIEGILKPTIEH